MHPQHLSVFESHSVYHWVDAPIQTLKASFKLFEQFEENIMQTSLVINNNRNVAGAT